MEDQGQIPVETPVETTDTVEQPVSNDWGTTQWNEGFLQNLPDELGNHSIFKKYQDPTSFIQGAINAQSHIGQKAEEFWRSEDPNDVAVKNEIMGVPQSADQYQYDIPDDIEISDEDVQEFSSLMHELGVTNEQAQAIAIQQLNNMVEIGNAMTQAQETALDNAEKELRETWTGDSYDYNLSKVSDALDYLGLSEWKDIPEIANNPSFLTGMVDKILPLFSEDELIEGGQTNSYASVKDQLDLVEAEIDKFTGQTGSAEYQNLIKNRFELLQMITPGN